VLERTPSGRDPIRIADETILSDERQKPEVPSHAPESYPTRRKRIGSRLIELESRQPGLVRIRVNPNLAPPAVELLKGMGFKKRFLQNPQQFIVDCALSYQQAMYELLPAALLTGPNSGHGHIHCWYGDGQYAGWQGLFQLSDFRSGDLDRTILVHRPFNMCAFGMPCAILRPWHA